MTSRPTRARGLKCPFGIQLGEGCRVAPHAGAWIEMARTANAEKGIFVAPYAGAWIEIRSEPCPHVGS